MLKNIKSSYFIQLVYTYVEFAQKLKLIKYNKYLQNLTGIHFSNYKYFSGKYIIYESNGIGKEYYGYNDSLKFEGEYLKGKRNGNGKEYDSYGKLKFEGEYLNGKRNGNGKEYDNNGKLLFEGEYLDGNRKGSKYDNGISIIDDIYKIKHEIENNNIKDKLAFKGEYLNGKRHGKGKEYDYEGNLIFKGEYLNDKRNGKGKEYNYNGKLQYYGEYLNGEKTGNGKEYDNEEELIFEGQYLYGRKIEGKSYINGYLEFEGEYDSNKIWNGNGYDKYGNIIYKLNKGKGKVKEYDDYFKKLKFEGECLYGQKNGI